MPLSRRLLIAASGLALPAALLRPAPGAAQTAFTPEGNVPERALGNKDAKVTVQEFFSLTCSHCADFQRETFPKVKAELIDTGKIRYVFRDFPLDQVALLAATVARALPPERYEPFVSALLSSQDRWAFARGVNSTEELAKRAILAGMSREKFDSVVADSELRRAILAEQQAAEKKYGVDSTPTFIFNDKKVAGAISYDQFLKAVEAAS